MSVKVSRHLQRMNALTEGISSPASDASSRTGPQDSRRRRVLRTGDLLYFDSPEEQKKIATRTKSVDENTPPRKSSKTSFRSMKKVRTSTATDSSREKKVSLVLTLRSSRGGEENIAEAPSAGETIRKRIKTPFRSSKKVKHCSAHIPPEKKNCIGTNASLSKIMTPSVDDNTENMGLKQSRVRLFNLNTDSASEERKNFVPNVSSRTENPLEENSQKRKSIKSPSRSIKKVKNATEPNVNVDLLENSAPQWSSKETSFHKEQTERGKTMKSPVVDNYQLEKTNFISLHKVQRRSLPTENSQPKRKIVKAKRLLNHTSNQLTVNESAIINTEPEVQTSLKKKRKMWQKQSNVDVDSFSEFNYSAENEDKQNPYESSAQRKEVEENIDEGKNKDQAKEESCVKDNSTHENSRNVNTIEIIDLVAESSNCVDEDAEQQEKIEESKQEANSTFEVVVTRIEEPISPSTSNPDPQLPDKSVSPIANLFHFDTSNEEVHPSTSGVTPETTSRRRTYELENSVNDVSLLKRVSEQDSFRISSISSGGDDFPEATAAHAKITLRRKFDKNDKNLLDTRISKITPPWMTDADEEAADLKDESSPETSTPMPVTKGRWTLLKDVLTKEKLILPSFNRNIHLAGSSTNETSTSVNGDRIIDIPSVTKVKPSKKQTPHSSFKNVSTKKNGSNVKMPNFAAIHKRALEKVENISEYKKRKEERAKMLLSGRRPSATQTPKKQMKKQLRFDPTTSDNPKPLDFIPLPSTPIPRHVVNESIDTTITPVKVQTPKISFLGSKENLFAIDRNILTPRYKGNNDKLNKVLTPKNNNAKREVLRFDNNCKFGCNIPKPVVVPKKEEIKAMIATKSKLVKSTVDTRRVMIKGVRSNRRFELLMNMRKGK